MLFDGRAFAKEIEDQVKIRISELVKKPKIVSVLAGDDPASVLYTALKQKAAQRVGIVYEIEHLPIEPMNKLKLKIAKIGKRKDVAGVMVQLPIPGMTRDQNWEIIQAIPLIKDMDGLRWESSGVVPATVRAILAILERIVMADGRWLMADFWKQKFVVIGTHGSVGKPLIHFLRKKGVVDIVEVNSQTQDMAKVISQGEVVISCVGRPGLIAGDAVKEGVIAMDVGISKVSGKVVGDMTDEVYQKASVAVPVPGGVGPVTVACLMENAADLAQ